MCLDFHKKLINSYIKLLFLIILNLFLNNLLLEQNKINNNYYLSEIFGNKSYINDIFFEYNNLNYYFSYKYNIVEINYNIIFYNKNKTFIKPSDLSLLNDLHVICYMEKENDTISFDSLANIIQNKHFLCTEFFNINEKIKFGIKIYLGNEINSTINLFDSNLIKYKKKNQNNTKFNPLIINNEYLNFINNISYINKNEVNSINLFGLKKYYINKPYCLDKKNIILNNNFWEFKNIYNNYFCLCKGKCLYKNISPLCKYLFYLYIIDNNKYIYNKTDYLLSDFYYFSSDDTFPIFKEMIKLNLNAHYMDTKETIYNKFCKNEKKCLKIISINNIVIDGDFLEKYLEIILKLKAIIVGHQLESFYNIFYDIDYITYINVGHGIKYFKHFLYNNYSSYKKYNKLVLPPSKKIISLAKLYGWTDDKIIKNCLPKWDKYDIYQNKIKYSPNYNKNNKSIFIMFTWRNLINNSYNISSIYLNNIMNLINNEELLTVLKRKNINLYFSFHPNFIKYKMESKFNEYVKYVYIEEISDCLMKTNLLVSDFSSIIFDMIYQRKPYIIFIPDAFDSEIKYTYEKGYYDIINSFKNKEINFKNIYLNLDDTIKKIIYYIENNFMLEVELEKFYDSFELKCKNNTYTFINYLVNEL